MEQESKQGTGLFTEVATEIRGIIHEALEEFARKEVAKEEPAYKNELAEERRRREQLERRMNELVQENTRNRKMAEEADRSATIRAELQRLGVAKVELAFKAVKDDVQRADDGRLVAVSEQGALGLREYLTHFVNENPEFLPARNLGGSGATGSQRSSAGTGASVDLEKIKPGMSAEDLERARQEISRIASQTLGGL